jgi:glycosyltransferase involved in cell wall biosynthesis
MTLTVLHTESSLGWGGQENRTLQESLVLRKLGARVLFLGQPGAKLITRATEDGFETLTVIMRRSFDIRAIFRIRKILKRERVDILNTHSGRDSLLAGIAGRLIGTVKVVRTRHLILPISSRISYSLLPHKVITVSNAVKQYLVNARIPENKIVAIPTGVDLANFDPERYAGDIRDELGLPRNVPLIGTVAILRYKKGHRTILDAIPAVLQEMPDTHFVFAGDGPQASELRAIVSEKKLSDRVHFLGLRQDIANVLKSLDIFVLTTLQEALGTAFLEAQAMGVPVIGTRVGGVPEALVEGETGLLVPPQDPSALAESILSLLRDPERRHRMAALARPWVQRNYSVELMGRSVHAEYLSLLNSGQSA